AHAPVARARQQQLRRLLRVRDREVELRCPLVLGRRDRRVGPARPRALDRLPPLRLRAAARRAEARPAARPDRRSGRVSRSPARVRLHGRARRDDRRQLLLPHDPVLLPLRLPGFRARPARGVRRPGARTTRSLVRVVVLTTSWPRTEREFAGRFVADAVERLRERGVEVEVLAPGSGYRDFGLAYGGGMAANVRRRPWAAPLMLLSMSRAVRRAARSADLVHAHWLLTTAVARFAGRPFVVTLHGSSSAGRFSDVELARRRPSLVRALLRPAAAVICVSETVGAAMRAAGVEVVVIPNGVRVPDEVGSPATPAEVLYVGRLSPVENVDPLI